MRTVDKQLRPTVDEYFMRMAFLVASRATCLRRSVGCVLVDARNHVLATGYNGRPIGMSHCNHVGLIKRLDGSVENIYQNACAGANEPSGTNLGLCEAVHAEQNALLQCPDPFAIETCYCTTLPCKDTCIKLLMNTSCAKIVYADQYPNEQQIIEFWTKGGSSIQKREIYRLMHW